MSLRLRGLVAALCGGAALVAATPAALAFQHTLTCTPEGGINGCAAGEEPRPLFWPTPCVTYHIHEAGTTHTDTQATFTAVQNGFSAWDEAECSYLQIEFGGFTDEDRVGYNPSSDNANIVVFRDTNWEHSRGILALTSVTFKASTGEIFDADIELNGQEYRFTTTDVQTRVLIDVQNTVTHEAGHFIGLDHSTTDDATMFATAPLRETKKRTLDPDDIAGICDIYPTTSQPAPGGVCWGAPVGFFERPLYGPGDNVPTSGDEGGTCACATPARHAAPAWGGLALIGLALIGAAVRRSHRSTQRHD